MQAKRIHEILLHKHIYVRKNMHKLHLDKILQAQCFTIRLNEMERIKMWNCSQNMVASEHYSFNLLYLSVCVRLVFSCIEFRVCVFATECITHSILDVARIKTWHYFDK